MFTSSKEFKKAMYNILVEFQNNPNFNDLLSKHSDLDFETALEECINQKFILGLTIQRASDNTGMLSINNPRISIGGLEFIETFKE